MDTLFDPTRLALFIPTFLFVSATPGMCMTLALTLGMTLGVRRTLWMMAGELGGVGLVATLSVAGMAAIMLRYPEFFTLFKLAGGVYLGYLGVQLWRSRGRMALTLEAEEQLAARGELALQGFVTAVANPKGWAFFIALLPPFIHPDYPLSGQVGILVGLILLIEFLCLLLYACGGYSLRRVLSNSGNVRLMNRIAGTLMIGVGFWLTAG